MRPKISPRLSLLFDDRKVDQLGGSFKHELAPSLKLHTDKDIYMPGDTIVVTIEIQNPANEKEKSNSEVAVDDAHPFLIDNLEIETKGIEKLDIQWYKTHKPLPGSKQKRGEQVFLDSTIISIISKVIVSSGCTRTYMVRTELPGVLPPSYRGTVIRYIYYVRSTLYGRWLDVENGRSNGKSVKDLIQLEARTPLHIWVTPKTSSLLTEEGQSDGMLPGAAHQMVIYWKEKDPDCDWARANVTSDGFEDGYDTSRDEISSVASYHHKKGNLDLAFGDSLSSQSTSLNPSLSMKGAYPQGERFSFPSYLTVPQLSMSEVLYDSTEDVTSPSGSSAGKNYSQQKLGSYSSTIHSSYQRRLYSNSYVTNDEMAGLLSPGTIDPITSENFIRGRSYNIRMDDQILLRFSPKNSDSTYYFGDLIGGTLTFFQEEISRRCLEVSITLETSETINQDFLHPSRRNSPKNTKVQSDHHEVVADLLQTSFLFSIPMDGPMSFTTSHVSVQWSLRFEFLTTPKNTDWTRYEHPLLVEGREKGEWVLPITVHAPPPRTQPAHSKKERPLSPGTLWVRS